jgi:hypothetical protein
MARKKSKGPWTGPPLSPEEETKIVALFARGETYENIRSIVKAETGRHVAIQTISNVKKRNKDNIALIKNKFLEREEENAAAIRTKANRVINRKLDNEERKLDALEKAREEYLAGKIDLDEYAELVKANKELSITEVTNVSKTMHEQAKTEEPPAVESKDTAALVEAMRSGDEVTIQQIIFNKGGTDAGTGQNS